MMRHIALIRSFAVICVLFTFVEKVWADEWVYTVREGDTLWGLCEKFTHKKDCWLKVGPYNNVDYPRNLAPGTRVRFPVEWLSNPPAEVEVMHVQGPVTYSLQEDLLKSTPLKKGERLALGAYIQVEENGLCILKFADGSTMVLEANTLIKLDKMSSFGASGMVDASVRLKKGAVQTNVIKKTPRSRFQVETPSAVAAVRGTNFRVAAVNDSQTRSEVFSGKIAVENSQGQQDVSKGQGLLVTKDKPIPPVVALPNMPTVDSLPNETTLPLEVRWASLDGVNDYYVSIVHDEGKFANGMALNTNKVSLESLPEGCFNIEVSAVNIQGFRGEPATTRTCVFIPLAAPSSLHYQKVSVNELANNHEANQENKIEENINVDEPHENHQASLRSEVGGTVSGLTWNKVAGAVRYKVELSSRSGFDKDVQEFIVSDTFYPLDAKAGSNLYARVSAQSEPQLDNWGKPSQTIKIVDTKDSLLERTDFKLFLVLTTFILLL